MRERDWETLIWSLQRDSCILLLGPDILGDGDSDITALRRTLLEELSDGGPDEASEWNLPAVAQRYLAEFGRSDLEREVVRFHDSSSPSRPELFDQLAALPFYFVITSRHDETLTKALAARGKTASVSYYHYRGDNEAFLPIGTTEAPLVYQLYGSVREPQSLVLTENDLLDFLVAVVSKNPPLPTSIRSELQKKEKCFLFLGFGIRRWYLRILLHVLQLSRSESRSFALEPLPHPSPPELEQTILFYRTGYRIEVFDRDMSSFLKELQTRFERAGGHSRPRLVSSGREVSPKVFICYASEDHAAAEDLYKALEAAGLRPWMDQRGIGGGEHWDTKIEDTIKDSDYVLVLQSQALASKSFSYVNKEIHLALERQAYTRKGFHYLIPLQIEDSEPLEELSELQTMPMRGSSDARELISTLKRDFQRRARR